jgi:hypothetical protein
MSDQFLSILSRNKGALTGLNVRENNEQSIFQYLE